MNILISILILSILALWIAQKVIPNHPYKYVLIAVVFMAMVLRFDTIFYMFSSGTESFGTDGLTYHLVGKSVASQLEAGVPFYRVEYQYTWYTAFVGILYHLFGPYRHIAAFVNVFMVFLSAMLLFNMALKQRKSFTIAAWVSIAFLYMPNMIFWTSDTLKESFMMLVLLLLWWMVQKITEEAEGTNTLRKRTIIAIAFLCFLMWLSTLIRIYLIVPITVGIVASQGACFIKKRNKISVITVVAALLAASVICGVSVYHRLDHYHALPLASHQEGHVSQNISGKAEVLMDIAEQRNLPKVFLNFMMLPFPNNIDVADIEGIQSLEYAVSIDMMFWYLCLLLALIRLLRHFRRSNSYMLGIFAFCAVYIIINALLTENISRTVFRYRCQIIWPILLAGDWGLLGLGWIKVQEKCCRMKGFVIKLAQSTISRDL